MSESIRHEVSTETEAEKAINSLLDRLDKAGYFLAGGHTPEGRVLVAIYLDENDPSGLPIYDEDGSLLPGISVYDDGGFFTLDMECHYTWLAAVVDVLAPNTD